MFETRRELQRLATRLHRMQGHIALAAPRRRLGVERLGRSTDEDRLGQQRAVATQHFVQARLVGQRQEVRMQLQFHLGADRACRHFADGVLLGVAGHVQMAQFRRLVRGGAHADPARQHEGRQEAEAEHADQALIVLATLAQAAGVADADGGQVVMDLLAGQAGAGIDDAQHAGSGIDLHRNARWHFDAGLFDAAADDRVVRVLHQLTQRHHRGGIQVLAQHRHQSI